MLLRGFFLPVLFGMAACRPISAPQHADARYLVTETPVDVGDGIRLCIAVSPSENQGLWWWGAGASGCDSRSTGPGVFHPDDARVSGGEGGVPVAASFRLGTHSLSRPYIDVSLVMENDSMRALETGARVRLLRRKTLEIPERPSLRCVARPASRDEVRELRAEAKRTRLILLGTRVGPRPTDRRAIVARGADRREPLWIPIAKLPRSRQRTCGIGRHAPQSRAWRHPSSDVFWSMLTGCAHSGGRKKYRVYAAKRSRRRS